MSDPFSELGEFFPGDIALWLQRLATERPVSASATAACLARIDEAAPVLLDLLARAAAGERFSEDDDLLAFRGLHVLAGARRIEAFGALLRLLRRPPDEVEDRLGDAVTETLPRIVAGLFDGDADALFGAIADDALDGFVRGGLLGAATFLCWEGRIDRDAFERVLARLPEANGRQDRDDYLWSAWVDAIGLLDVPSLEPLARSAMRAGRISRDLVRESDLDEMLKDARRAPREDDRFLSIGLGYLEDVFEVLEQFVETDDERSADDLDAWRPPVREEPALNPWRGVGRNDPCPCGSGRKAKKCCLA